MNKKELKQIERVNEIKTLASKIIERATGRRGGSACMVPSSQSGHMPYRVDIDENYNPIRCQCKGFNGYGHCKHCEAAVLYFAPRIEKLLSKKNPICLFKRSGVQVRARVSQLSKTEKQALRQQLADERRVAYVNFYNPGMVA